MATVLVIDDLEHIRTTLARILLDAGHRVTTASNGDAACTMIRGGLRPDLIVCDIFLPWRSGIELLPEFRRLAPGVPVLAMTGYLDEAVEQAGFDGVIQKPMTAVGFLATVARWTTN